MTQKDRKIPWMYNEAYNPFYEIGQEYLITPDDIEHLQEHQQEYIISSVPKELYEDEYKL